MISGLRGLAEVVESWCRRTYLRLRRGRQSVDIDNAALSRAKTAWFGSRQEKGLGAL